MGINKLPSLEDYWSRDNCIRNEKIPNVMHDKSKVSKFQELCYLTPKQSIC